MKRNVIILLVLVLVIVVFSIPTKQNIEINGQRLSVSIADSPREWERGLSGRKSLKSDEGMLFAFPEPTVPSFWMKDMRFAIDIIWLDDALRIIGIERNVTPDTYPTTYKPPSAVRYVLETNPNVVTIGDL